MFVFQPKAQEIDALYYEVTSAQAGKFSMQIEICGNYYEFVDCVDNKKWGYIRISNGGASIDFDHEKNQHYFRLNGYIVSLEEIYEGIFFKAEVQAEDMYYENEAIVRAEENHAASYW